MERQLKKGVLEIYVMAILMRENSYGYKIVNDLKEYIEISESTLYPILRRLLKQGKLSSYNEVFEGRNRKYYEVTKKGKEEVKDFIVEWENIKKVYDMLVGVNL